MDKVGVLAHDALDCSIVLNVIKGADPLDITTTDSPFKPTFTKAAERVRRLKVGYVKEDYEKHGESDVAKAFAEALSVFRQVGVEPVEATLPNHPYETIASTIIAAEEAAAFEPLVRSGRISGIIDPDRRGELLGGQLITAVDYLRCQRRRTLMLRDFDELFSRFDIILGSSTLKCAPSVDATMDSIFPGGNVIEAAENLMGLPGVSIPCGFSKQKLPIGLKIIGRPFAEADILEAAHLYQSLTEWHKKHPKL
jgi:aspartyl-tRNA(Asn)/glutamyl-tRNA(Gln) amidotransferase subunit A